MIEIPIIVLILVPFLCLVIGFIPAVRLFNKCNLLKAAGVLMRKQRDEARREVCGSLPAQMSSPQVLANLRMGTADMRGWSYLYEEEKEWLDEVSIEPRIHSMYMKGERDND